MKKRTEFHLSMLTFSFIWLCIWFVFELLTHNKIQLQRQLVCLKNVSLFLLKFSIFPPEFKIMFKMTMCSINYKVFFYIITYFEGLPRRHFLLSSKMLRLIQRQLFSLSNTLKISIYVKNWRKIFLKWIYVTPVLHDRWQ